MAEVNQQLGDDQQLGKDPTEALSTEIADFIEQIAEQRSIDTHNKKFLTPLNSRPGHFYMLPKIHKPNNPGRPIIASCDAPTEKISMFVEFDLL